MSAYSRSKDMALIILTDTASSLSHQHCMTASAMDQIYFCSELGVREPGSQPRGKRTRADWGSWEEQGKVGEAGSNLAKLASSQTSAESQARGNSYCGNMAHLGAWEKEGSSERYTVQGKSPHS